MLSMHLIRHLRTALRHPQRRSQLLQGVGMLATLGAGMAAYAFLHEPLRVRLEQLTLHLPGAAGHLPPQGLRILHLSDTHFSGKNWREQPKIKSILHTCAGLDYDILIHTGDFLHYDSGLANVLQLLDALPRPRLGSYAVFGNHDYSVYSHAGMIPRTWSKFREFQHEHGQDDVQFEVKPAAPGRNADEARTIYRSFVKWQNTYLVADVNAAPAARGGKLGGTSPLTYARTVYAFGQYFANSPLELKRTGRNNVSALEEALEARGIHLLHNCYVRLTQEEAGVDIYLAGVDDVVEGTPELSRALAEIPYDAPTILLSHNPDILTDPGIDQVDLVLAGHTHGGQIVLPLLGAVHTQTAHLRRCEVSGYLRRGKTQVYITRGIGEGIPLRFGAAPQVTLLTLLPA
jgi:predicted MPP superfamily phosphohydrolase